MNSIDPFSLFFVLVVIGLFILWLLYSLAKIRVRMSCFDCEWYLESGNKCLLDPISDRPPDHCKREEWRI